MANNFSERVAQNVAQTREGVSGVAQIELEHVSNRNTRAIIIASVVGCLMVLLTAGAIYFAIQKFFSFGTNTKGGLAEEVRTTNTSSKDITRRAPPVRTPPVVATPPAAAPVEEPKKEEVKIVHVPAQAPAAEPGFFNLPASGKKEKTLTERQLESGMMPPGNTGKRQMQNLLDSYGAEGEPRGEKQYASSAGLGEKLRPIEVEKGTAMRMKNRHLTLAQGTFINCIMETAVDTTVPGMTTCRIPENVFSMDGRTLLIERGSRVFGEYRGAVANGLARIFLLWTRVETPHGVIIDLNSPSTDSLGRAGLTGEVDNHWWQRFGSALLFSLVQDGFDFAMTKANKSSETNYYGNSQDSMNELVREAMKWAGNIPPTLHVNQGAGIGIYVARPIDMSNIYRLESEEPGYRIR